MQQVWSRSECCERDILEQSARQTQFKILELLLGELIKMNLQEKIKLVEETLSYLNQMDNINIESESERKSLAQYIVNILEITKSNGKN